MNEEGDSVDVREDLEEELERKLGDAREIERKVGYDCCIHGDGSEGDEGGCRRPASKDVICRCLDRVADGLCRRARRGEID